MTEIPVKVVYPTSAMDRDRKPLIVCGKRVRLRGKLVECIRRAGHPVTMNYGHSNGIDEWAFEEEPGEEV